MTKKVFLPLLLCTFFLLTSCKNFLNGNSFIEDLDAAIVYANGETYSLVVMADEGTGEIVVGADEHKLKVTDSFEATFRKNSGYKFIKWGVFSKSGAQESLDDYIIFSSLTELTTKITLAQGSNDIQIKPICEKVLAFTQALPADEKNGVPRDSGIVLTTNFPLSQDNDLSQIEITIEGSSADGRYFFNDPELLSGNRIYIGAKLTNRISVNEGEINKITVTLPANFIYESDKGTFEIGEELSYSYRINSETCDKALVTYGIPLEGSGAFKVNGIVADAISQSFNIGDRATVTFKENDGYRFLGWDNSDENAIVITPLVDAGCDENGYNSSTKTATATIISIGQATNVIVKVNVEKIPDADITGYSPYGRFTFDISKNYYEGTSGTLGFTTNTEYQFVRWQIWDVNANNGYGAEIENKKYINIKDPDSSTTTFYLDHAPAKDSGISLRIQPVCVERPIILTTTPVYSNSGCYRDEQITIVFDHPMADDSIYFTTNEIPDFEEKLIFTSNREGKEGKIYAYADYVKDSDGNNQQSNGKYLYVNKVYKNIEITDLQDQSTLTEYFDEPYFETDTKLIIRTARDGSNSYAPPGSSQIVVNISKEMYSIIDGKAVTLASNKKFNYVTNQSTDITLPEFPNSTQPVVKISKGNAKTSIDTESANYDQMVYSLSTKLEMFLCFTDAHSGPDSANMYFKRVYNQNYDKITENESAVSLTCNTSDDGKHKYFGKNLTITNGNPSGDPEEIPLSRLNKGDGVYEICFGIKDINGNERRSQTYYVLRDTTKPTLSNSNFNNDNFAYSCNTSEKFCRIKAVYTSTTNGGSPYKNPDMYSSRSNAKTPSINSYRYTTSTTVNSQSAATIHATFVVEDLAGNISTNSASFDSWTKITAAPILNTDADNTGTPEQWMIDCLKERKTGYNNAERLDYKYHGRYITATNKDIYKITGYKVYENGILKGSSPWNNIYLPYASGKGWKTYTIYPYVTINGKDYVGTTPFYYDYLETYMVWCMAEARGTANDICFKYGVVFDSDHKVGDLNSSYRRYEGRNGTNLWTRKDDGAAGNDDYRKTVDAYTCFTAADSCGQNGYHWAYNLFDHNYSEIDGHIVSFVATQSTTPNIQFNNVRYN